MNNPAPVDPAVHDLVRQRWSPRTFADRGLEPEALRSLFEAAQWAPSAFNEQPWAFIVATRDLPEAFERLLGCLVPGNQSWAKQAPVLMLTAAKLAFERNGKPNRHAFHDLGLAVAQLTLQATSLGLGVHQMAGIDGGKVRQTYGIPEDWEPVTAIAVGYFGDPASLPEGVRQRELAARSRKPLAELVFAEGWETAADIAG